MEQLDKYYTIYNHKQRVPLILVLFLLLINYASGKGRIVGGGQVQPNELPYQVAMRFVDVFACSGAILDERHVVTSGECAEKGVDFGNEFYATVGDHHLDKMDNFEQTFNISKIIIHPGYYSNRSAIDIAVLELENSIEFSAGAQPIRLPPSNHRSSGKVIISGWGSTSYEGPISPILRKSDQLTIISDNDCREYIQAVDIVDSSMCILHPPDDEVEGFNDACDKDSGAPTVCREVDGGQQSYLCGIVSWGIGCANGMPRVTTEVSYFTPWILQFATNAQVIQLY